MRISLRWLKEMTNLDLTAEQIADRLTMAGLEVEDELDLGIDSKLIVVAQVLEFAKHPGADKLNVCKVDVGADEPVQIVCGAPNVEAGTKYPCALPGAVLPGNFKIKKSKIRGVESFGMLCSGKELGMSADAAGIMALPEDWKTGSGFDYLCEIKITPNRADCTSMLGIARELAACEKEKVFPPQPRVREMLDPIDRYVDLTVPDKFECPRYACRLVRGVKIGPSPAWMRVALEASGLRSINNVVDVTNFVLLELGHPLHAFDMDKLEGQAVKVRLAKKDEKLTVIDGTEIDLTCEDLVICDAKRPIALAGVMGGRDSEVSGATVNVLIESAYFDPGTIRKTARRFGMNTDASYRFERGADRERLTVALNRTTQLIYELAGGEVAKGHLDVQATSIDRSPIALEIGKVNRVLGVKLTGAEVADYLVGLEFEIRRSERDTLVVVPPSHRVDISRPEDLIEEVARAHNYNRIPATLPRILPVEKKAEPSRELLDAALDSMIAQGFCEAINYNFISERECELMGCKPAGQPRLANPLTADQTVMRPSLIPGLLNSLALNQKQNEHSVLLVESGKVWRPAESGGDAIEGIELAAVMAGPLPPHWGEGARIFDFFDIKGAAENVAELWGGSPTSQPLTDCPWLHPGRAASLVWRGKTVGEIGEIHPDLADAFDLNGRVYALQLNPEAAALVCGSGVPKFKPIPKFPGSHRDLALVVDRALPAGNLLETANKASGAIVESTTLFDVYEGEHVAEDKKSVALRIHLRSIDKTLTEDEIQAATNKILKRLEKDCGATLRA